MMDARLYKQKIGVFERKVETHRKQIKEHEWEIAKLNQWLSEDSARLEEAYKKLAEMEKSETMG